MRIEGHVIAREGIFDPQYSSSMAVGMRMLLVMPPEQVIAVVVPVLSPAFRPQAFGVMEWICVRRFRLKAGLRTAPYVFRAS